MYTDERRASDDKYYPKKMRYTRFLSDDWNMHGDQNSVQIRREATIFYKLAYWFDTEW